MASVGCIVSFDDAWRAELRLFVGALNGWHVGAVRSANRSTLPEVAKAARHGCLLHEPASSEKGGADDKRARLRTLDIAAPTECRAVTRQACAIEPSRMAANPPRTVFSWSGNQRRSARPHGLSHAPALTIYLPSQVSSLLGIVAS